MCHQHEHKLENFHPLSNETGTQQQENRDEQNKAKEMAKIAFYLRMLRHFHAEKARTFNLEQQQKGSVRRERGRSTKYEELNELLTGDG